MSAAGARNSSWLAVLLLLVAAASSGADRYDPRLRFRTTRTAHFDIHWHQGEEALARRLAAIAERVQQRFEPVFGRPRGRVQVIVVDQSDISNGWATPFPYDAIEISAAPPPPESILGNTTDWLALAFTHEYTHILHLDRTRGVMQGVRRVFGRVPFAFPNLFLPVWQVEGLATYEESRMTGQGRVPAGDFRALVDVAAANGRFEPIDRASGGLTDWPGGDAAYAYGAYFHQYLADRYGPERLSRLADASSGRVPLFGGASFTRVFGRSAVDLWKDFQAAHESAAVRASDTDARATRLTHHGFVVTAPRAGDDGTLYYRLSNADGFPSLMRLPPGGTPARVAWRARGNRTSVRGGWIVFDQVERVRSVAVVSDLYAVRTAGGAVHRLTRAARAADPDLSPDGRVIVCTTQERGRRALALVDFPAAGTATPRVLAADADSDFSGPRWSPDGRQIVAARRREGNYELVLIDPATGAVRTLLNRADARLATPSWTPDGGSVLFSADPGDAPFNVFAVDIGTREVRQVTDSATGAEFPEIAADGTLTFVGYTPDGYDLFSIAADPGSWKRVDFLTVRNLANPPVPESPGDAPYHPWRTLAPTYWTPAVASDSGETVFGAGTAMFDALGRHAYAIDAGWAGGRARPDWNVSYAYDRWWPTVFASYSDDTDPIRGGEVRSRELFAGMLLPFRRLRFSETLLAGFDAELDTLACTTSCRPAAARRALRSVRGGWLHDSRRQYGYSISSEEGFAVEAALESSRTAFGSDTNAGAGMIDLRGFQRVFGPHTVLAGRAAVAASWGAAGGRRVFSAAGAGPSAPAFDFGRDAIGLLRGFAPEDVVGTRAAVANVDLRFPIARPQRGAGTWPAFLNSVHGAVFLDAGHAWDTAFRAADVRTALGGELSANLVLAHYLPLTVAGGAAWTRDPAAGTNRAAAFGRVGYAF
jgi:hypothetical protein